jgi:molybdenum cofactor cytidylyltransferase
MIQPSRPESSVAGLILAAGASQRMGRDKPLLLYRGRTFLETVIATLREAGASPLAVVLGHHAAGIRRAVDLTGVEVVINADYRRGQTSSLQAGLRALEAAKPAAIVLGLVDHPAVPAEVVRRLIAAWQESRAAVVIPTHGGRRGHPVVVAAALFPELLALDPAQGANAVLRRYGELTRLVEVADPGILIDVDDPAAHHRLEEG